MENAEDLLNIYDRYILLYPHEASRLKLFQSFISAFTGEQLYHRKNFAGHITASAIVVYPADATILMLEHKNLKRWLQPGGHVDETDSSILQAAFRELKEEANISNEQVRLVSPSALQVLPVDTDSHFIPANLKKQEPGHYHHDLRYLLIYTGDKEISFNRDESVNYKWEPFDLLGKGDVLNICIKKIKGLISFNNPLYPAAPL